MIAVNGSFKATIRSPNREWSEHFLESPENGLMIGPLEWLELTEFSPDAVCLVLASEEHDEDDCVRDYKEYIDLCKVSP